MADKPTIVPFRAEDLMPRELIERLEHAIECAKEGTLKECIFDYCYDQGAEAVIHDDGSPLMGGGHFFWRSDGRLDALYAQLGVLHHRALKQLVSDDDE